MSSPTPAPMGGKLRVYLGAAPGVGKTYAMLNEAHRRLERGTDVVVGLVETHGRAKTAALLDDLDVPEPVVLPLARFADGLDLFRRRDTLKVVFTP